MDTQTLVIFALVAALGLVTVVAVEVMLTMQEAEARSVTGQCASSFRNSTAQNCPRR
jgi:hypothetical protein